MQFTRRNFLKMTVGSTAIATSPALFAKAAEATTIPKRKFGRHDDMLTVVGLGGHTLYLAGSQKEANAIADRAIDLGVNFFDNAWDYHDGEAEKYAGIALQGKRDKLFLMSKMCNYHKSPRPATVAGAMQMLEDSLTRLKTDHLDLWMMHNITDDDVEDAYRTDGAIEALELAKKQGKVRYIGFTGHTDPALHVDMIKRGYPWDATLMPVSVVGALKSRQFENEVMPLCVENDIAVLGMKGFGGSRRTHLHERTNVEEALRYSLSYPQVCTHLVGVDKLEYVDQAVAGTAAAPMTASERKQFVVSTNPLSPDYAAMQHGGILYEKGLSPKSHNA